MQALIVLDEDAHIGPTIEEEGDLMRKLISDGVAGSGAGAKERDPHDDPSLDAASVEQE
jgi:hypothetical protein